MTTTTTTKRETPYTLARQTCAQLLAHADKFHLPVRVNANAAADLRNSLDVSFVQDFGASLAQNANFTGLTGCDFGSNNNESAVDCEAAWIVLTHAVDFGSGWRRALHQHHGKGAWLTIKPGIEALFRLAQAQQATHLPAAWLQGLTHAQVATAFGLPPQEGGNDELNLLVEYLVVALHDLGRGAEPYGSLQALVKGTLKQVAMSATPAGDFVWMLVDVFPTTFNDRYMLFKTQEVCFYKKAQLVTGELYHRFRNQDERFAFADGSQLTAYIDNVIVASLRYKKVVVPNDALTEAIETGQEIPSGSVEEVSLRAAAMCGVEAVVQGTPLPSCELGNYMWAGLGKEPNVRKFARHATKTIFY